MLSAAVILSFRFIFWSLVKVPLGRPLFPNNVERNSNGWSVIIAYMVARMETHEMASVDTQSLKYLSRYYVRYIVLVVNYTGIGSDDRPNQLSPERRVRYLTTRRQPLEWKYRCPINSRLLCAVNRTFFSRTAEVLHSLVNVIQFLSLPLSLRNNTAARKSFLEILVAPAPKLRYRRRLPVLSSQLQPTSPFSGRLYDRDTLPTTLSNIVSSRRRIALHVETSAGLYDSVASCWWSRWPKCISSPIHWCSLELSLTCIRPHSRL